MTVPRIGSRAAAATPPLPAEVVPTGVLQSRLARILGRPVTRQEILHLKIRRAGARSVSAGDAAGPRIGPSAGEGRHRAGLWSFGDSVRLAAILGVSPAPPLQRARIWAHLNDERIAALVKRIREQLDGLATEGIRLAKLARVGGFPRRDLARELLFLLPASERRYLLLPCGGDRAEPSIAGWPAQPATTAGVWLDLGAIILRCLLAWDVLLPAAHEHP